MNRMKTTGGWNQGRLIIVSRKLDRSQAHKFAEHFKDLFTPILVESNRDKMKDSGNIYTTYKVCRIATAGEFIEGHESE